MIKRNRPVGNIVQQLSDAANKLTKGEPYYVKNFTQKREFDANTATLAEVRNVLATLIMDFEKLKGKK